MAKRTVYSAEQLAFLEHGYRKWGVPELTDKFNEEFGTYKKPSTIKGTLRNRGFKSGRTTGELNKGKSKLFTPEQVEWIKEKYKDISREELHKALCEKFGLTVSMSQLVAFLKNHGIKSGRTGQWGEKSSWNKGLRGKGICKANSGSFKPGKAPPNRKPMYSERTNTDGYIEIKVPAKCKHTGRLTKYVLKHRWVYEQNKGAIPKGMAVIFKDGNSTNFDLDNLVTVTRRQLALLNIRNYFEVPAVLKEAIWNLTVLESKTIGMELSDGTKSHRELVIDCLGSPVTAIDIEKKTGVSRKQVSTLLWRLKKIGQAALVGTTKQNNRRVNVWVAASQ